MLKASRGDVGGSEGRSEVPEKVNRPSAGSYMAMNVGAVCGRTSLNQWCCSYTVPNPDAKGASDPRAVFPAFDRKVNAYYSLTM